MATFQASTSSKNDPAATDLDYYSKPENYTGSNLQSLQRFKADKTKEDNSKKKAEKKKIVKDAKYYFFHRYKHILQDVIFLDDLLESEHEESDAETDDEETAADKAADAGLVTITEEIPDGDHGRKSQSSLHSVDLAVSPDRPPAGTFSGLIDECSTPDSTGFLTPSGKKRQGVTPSPSGGKQFTAIQRMEKDKAAKEVKAKQLKERFRKCVINIKAICRLSASARGKQSAGDMASMRTFMDIANDEATTEENMKNAGLSFDPTYFKAKKEISLSSETKHILTTAPESRTADQVQTAMFGLQSLRSYAEYPLHMQEKLAKVAWYEVVAPKRIIIRQGHFAENFYFILSGHAVVTLLLKDPKTGSSFVKTAAVMKKGMSFGELALLHHSKRTATVTSQDTVQLLSIGREDFFDIFMSRDGDDNMPEHIRFVSNLDFMRDWPIDELLEHPEHCLLHFFKRNTAIVANSNVSDWLYIVKSGSCVVLKKLKGVTPNAYMTKPKVNDNQVLPPKLRPIVFDPKVDSGIRKRQKSEEGKDSDKPKTDGDRSRPVKFSKEAYSKNPTTRPAHFSTKSSFAKRKRYEPPQRCVPKKKDTDTGPPPKPGPVFVQVSIMKPRDVFGLDSLKFEDDITRTYTTVSLVSRGAECIMLSKDFFVKHANEAVKKCIRESVSQYPDEEVFQDNLQIKEDWGMYKKVMSNDLVAQISEYSNRLNS